jgi:hypothetical protein
VPPLPGYSSRTNFNGHRRSGRVERGTCRLLLMWLMSNSDIPDTATSSTYVNIDGKVMSACRSRVAMRWLHFAQCRTRIAAADLFSDLGDLTGPSCASAGKVFHAPGNDRDDVPLMGQRRRHRRFGRLKRRLSRQPRCGQGPAWVGWRRADSLLNSTASHEQVRRRWVRGSSPSRWLRHRMSWRMGQGPDEQCRKGGGPWFAWR